MTRDSELRRVHNQLRLDVPLLELPRQPGLLALLGPSLSWQQAQIHQLIAVLVSGAYP